MEDLTGRQLGPYQIVAPLGEGGMAAVYKAYQPGMDRYVALKILPRKLAEDPEFVGRFNQEAKVLAKLQHPHILPVFDFGEADGYTYIVMPFVESGTLAGLLRGQPLPVKQIRSIISQIGGALNYAHSHGLVHRDVKPSNVLIDETGNCLLTDFGIAKMVEGTAKFTSTGAVIGTPAYMSPEQGRGEKLDGRSDIYSLGIILYEMATGRVPFHAETPVAIIFKHISDPLPMPRATNPALPESVERVILKALAKSAEDRFQTAAEMVEALEGIAETKTSDRTAPTVIESAPTLAHPTKETGKGKAPTGERKRVSPIVVGIGIVAVVGVGVVYSSRTLTQFFSRTTSLPAATITVIPNPTPNATATALSLVLSSTTPRVVFVSDRDGNREIYVMGIDGGAQTNLTKNAADDIQPSWSPDGAKIAFVSNRDGNNEIYVMNADGSEPIRLTKDPTADTFPKWSSDGTRIAFVSRSSDGDILYVMAADGSRVQRASHEAIKGFSWSPDGRRIAYISQSSLQLFVTNPDRSGLVQLTQSIKGFGQPVWSPNGDRIAFGSYHEFYAGYIYVVGNDGGQPELLTSEVYANSFSWSPDGREIVANGNLGRSGLFIAGVDNGDLTQIYDGLAEQIVWLADAERISFVLNSDIYTINADKNYALANLTNTPGYDGNADWWRPQK